MSSPFDAGRDAATGGYGFGEQPGVGQSFTDQTVSDEGHFGAFNSEAQPPSEALGEPAGGGPSSDDYTYPTPQAGGDLF